MTDSQTNEIHAAARELVLLSKQRDLKPEDYARFRRAMGHRGQGTYHADLLRMAHASAGFSQPRMIYVALDGLPGVNHFTLEYLKAIQAPPLTQRERHMLSMLKLAIAYVGKGCAEHAYDGCVVSGETALAKLERFVDEVEHGKV